MKAIVSFSGSSNGRAWAILDSFPIDLWNLIPANVPAGDRKFLTIVDAATLKPKAEAPTVGSVIEIKEIRVSLRSIAKTDEDGNVITDSKGNKEYLDTPGIRLQAVV